MALPVYSKMKDSAPQLEDRKKGALKIRQDSPEKVPVVIERAKRSLLPDLIKFKYLFHASFTVGEVVEFIKGKLDYPSEVPLYFYINGIIPSNSATMGELYQEYREQDYLLYIGYCEDNIHNTSNP